jgi:uncharacterized LabA/DUF88 family protein
MKTVAVFVDVQNIYYTTRQQFACHFDYNRFWAEATRDRKVVKAIAFAIDRRDEKQKQFQDILRGIGSSGDGDFDLLVQKIRDKYPVSVEVYGVAELTAASLILAADKFVPIRDHLLLRMVAPRRE